MRLPLLALLLCSASSAQDASPADFVNQYLPGWIRLGGEARVRYEGFTGNGFKHNSDDDHELTRLRLNLILHPVDRLSFVFQAQDARVFGTGQSPIPTAYQDKVDLRIGYVEIGNSEHDLVSVRAGRQEMNFGEQRMLGYNSWRNTAQSFDAVRLIVRHGDVRFDIFASGAVQIQDRFDRPVPGNNLHGIYGEIKRPRRRFTVEPYALWRLSPSWRVEAGGFGRLDVMYYGAHIFGKTGKAADYDSEIAAETGHSGSDRVRAWAGHWRAGYTFRTYGVTVHALGEYNYATGDRNPHDGLQGGFTAPYPSAHDRYGLADQIGWKNIHHVRTGAELQLSPRWRLLPNIHNYWLASRTDGLFTPGNLQLARVEKGARSNRVGWEADLSAAYAITKSLEAGIGFTRLFAGAFLKEAAAGVAYNYGYCQLNYRF